VAREPNWRIDLRARAGIHYRVAINKGESHNIDGPVWHVRTVGGKIEGRRDLYKEEAVALALALNKVRNVRAAIEANRRRENGHDVAAPFCGNITIRRPDLGTWRGLIREQEQNV